jgi:hypothetical protein
MVLLAVTKTSPWIFCSKRLIAKVFISEGRDSAVGIATGYRLKDKDVRVRVSVGSRILFSMSFRPAQGPIQPPIQWVPRALSPRVKWPVREADHSLPTSVEVKKTWICTSTPILLNGVVLN